MSALPVDYVVSALFGFLVTVLALGGWLRFGASRALVALPNERSSHVRPTPTGGGVAIVLVVLTVLVGYLWLGVGRAGVLCLALLVIALLGLADDLWDLSARVRLGVQILTVGGLLWAGDSIARAQLGGLSDVPWPVLLVALTLAIAWFLNLFNFMDGIDGLAAAQGLAYGLGALFFMQGDPGWLGGLLWVLVAACLGFLVFNAAPARIFMGDAGSAFLGLALGWLALELALINVLPLIASLVLLSPFWFDATYTLCTRLFTGQKFTQAHRSHLYQRLADRLGHGRTTLTYALLWLLWDAPLVYWCRSLGHASASGLDLIWWAACWWVLPVACLPLLIGCVLLQAGRTPIVGNDSS